MISTESGATASDDDAAAFSLAFVLLSAATLPQPSAVVVAARDFGLRLTVDPETDSTEEGIQFYDDDQGRVLMLMLMDKPHPDAGQMAHAVTSPDPDAAAAAGAHLIVTTLPRSDDVRERDALTARLVAAVVKATPCVGAMLGHGTVFHNPELFLELDPECSGARLPVEVCVDLTVGRESDETLSFLTHNMERYGREDIMVHASMEQPNEAFDFAMTMASWMLGEAELQLPTGDTVGRSPDEKVVVQRGPSPIDPARTVMILQFA